MEQLHKAQLDLGLLVSAAAFELMTSGGFPNSATAKELLPLRTAPHPACLTW